MKKVILALFVFSSFANASPIQSLASKVQGGSPIPTSPSPIREARAKFVIFRTDIVEQPDGSYVHNQVSVCGPTITPINVYDLRDGTSLNFSDDQVTRPTTCATSYEGQAVTLKIRSLLYLFKSTVFADEPLSDFKAGYLDIELTKPTGRLYVGGAEIATRDLDAHSIIGSASDSGGGWSCEERNGQTKCKPTSLSYFSVRFELLD